MESKRLYSPTYLKEVLNRHGFKLKKALGQNFLIDGNIVRKIITTAGITKEDCCIEIGPGMGTLTEELCLQAKRVLAIEKDKTLMPVLQDTLQGFNNCEVVFGDVLELDLKKLILEKLPGENVKVVANLPYYITTAILEKLLESDLPLDSISVMVQKEVADRIVAKPNSKDYGALTLLIGIKAKAEYAMKVPRSVFIPQPNVDSAVVRLSIRKEKLTPYEKELSYIIKAAFSKRRKTILNAISSYDERLSKDIVREALNACSIEESRRGESLSLEEYIELAKSLKIYLNS